MAGIGRVQSAGDLKTHSPAKTGSVVRTRGFQVLNRTGNVETTGVESGSDPVISIGWVKTGIQCFPPQLYIVVLVLICVCDFITKKWRRRESNPGPKMYPNEPLRV